MLILPAGAGMDETEHIARTMQVANGQFFPVEINRADANQRLRLLPSNPNPQYNQRLYGGPLDANVMEQAYAGLLRFQLHPDSVATFPPWHNPDFNLNLRYNQGTTVLPFSNTAINSPLVYAPQAVCFSLARLLTDHVYWLIMAMRLGGLLVYLFLGLLAIRLIPVGKWIMASILLLPSSILTNVTVSADTVTLGLALVFIAACLRLLDRPGLASPAEWAALGVSGIFLGVVKMTYFPLLLLLILIPLMRQEYRRRDCLLKLGLIGGLGVLLLLGWYWVVHSINTCAMFFGDVDPAVQVHVVLSRPVRFLVKVFRILLGRNYFQIGYTGVFDRRFHDFYSGWISILTLALAGVFVVREKIHQALLARPVCLFFAFLVPALASAVLIVTAVYLHYNQVGSDAIVGVQERYLIPLLPLIFLAPIFLLGKRVDPQLAGQLAEPTGYWHRAGRHRTALPFPSATQAKSALRDWTDRWNFWSTGDCVPAAGRLMVVLQVCAALATGVQIWLAVFGRA